MPSPGEDIQSWSTTAASNGTADPLIVWSEGQARASVNNSARSEMAAHAKNRNLLNGSIVTTGAADTQAFLSGVSYTSIPTGLVVKLKIGTGLTNTGSTTLNMDGIGATLIKTTDGNNLLGGELVADGYADLLYNGTNWIFLYSREFFWERITGGGGIILGKQVFSTPGTFTYTPTAGMECVIVECIAAGGGGGGGYAVPGWGQGGAGGGGGSYSRSILDAAAVGASQTVTVGAGGAGGSAVGPAAGAAGGNTSFGALVVANGGSGGMAAYNVTATFGGAGGAAGTGDIAVAGSDGECGGASANVSYVMAQGGSGGPGPFGGRGTSNNSNGAVTGDNAPIAGYGGGGGGGVGWHGVAGSGGSGAGGLCIVTEFAGRGAPGRDGDTGAAGPIGPPGPAGAGTGDVLVSGTPAAGQIAEWVDTSHIRGVAPPIGFTTGDAKLTLKTTADSGWVMMNDGTIGNTSSGASTRANADCQDLFTLLWNNIADAWAPVVGGRGASAVADWTANKKLTLTRQLGRSLSIAGAGSGLTSRTLGGYAGEETHVQTIAEMAAHNHPGSAASSPYPIAGSAPNAASGVDFQAWAYVGPATGVVVASQGSGTASNVMHPVSFWNIMIKL